MKAFFIDTENVHREWVPFVLSMALHHKCYLYYTKNSPSVPVSALPSLSKIMNSLIFRECECGSPNALDFQLASDMGYEIGQNDPGIEEYVIISEDKGYNVLASFWNARGASVRRVPVRAFVDVGSLIPSESVSQPANDFSNDYPVVPQQAEVSQPVCDIVSDTFVKDAPSDDAALVCKLKSRGYKADKLEFLVDLFMRCSNCTKQSFLPTAYQTLSREYGPKQARKIYNNIKSLLQSYYTEHNSID